MGESGDRAWAQSFEMATALLLGACLRRRLGFTVKLGFEALVLRHDEARARNGAAVQRNNGGAEELVGAWIEHGLDGACSGGVRMKVCC